MEKKTPPSLKEPAPNQPQFKTDMTFEQAMHLAATTPKHVVDKRMKEAKKRSKKAK
jgi:hypothetical protein